jgi:hypothetical protein
MARSVRCPEAPYYLDHRSGVHGMAARFLCLRKRINYLTLSSAIINSDDSPPLEQI